MNQSSSVLEIQRAFDTVAGFWRERSGGERLVLFDALRGVMHGVSDEEELLPISFTPSADKKMQPHLYALAQGEFAIQRVRHRSCDFFTSRESPSQPQDHPPFRFLIKL
jgi:hypothetical protein